MLSCGGFEELILHHNVQDIHPLLPKQDYSECMYFLQILGDSWAQIELPVVFVRKAVRFDEAGVLKGL